MPEKNEEDLTHSKNDVSEKDKQPDTLPDKKLHNPFEKGNKLSAEEIESIEEFKEAQTERD